MKRKPNHKMADLKHPREEMTLVLIKPDGVKRGLTGEIIKRIEQRGLKVISLSMEQASREKMDNHYPKSKEWISRLGEKTLKTYGEYGIDAQKQHGTNDPYKIGLEVRRWLLDYMISGPVAKVVIKGIHAIEMVRKLAGTTLPYKAELGSIRGDFSVDSPAAANKDKRAIHNLMHASETPEEAAHEIAYWFKKDELHDYKRVEEDLML